MATTFPLPPQPQVKPIHLFKIITSHNLHEGKLMIPNKFVEKHGEGLPNALFLKTPNGTEWNLKLEKGDGKIWFQEGWKEFAELFSLAHGHLLFFRRQSTFHFQVHIFDLSSLEIDYPSKRTEGKTPSNNQGNKPPNDENLEYHKPGQKRKDNSSLVFLQPYQKRSRARQLTLPSKFCRRHFGLHKKQRLINLQVLNGRVWSVTFLINKDKTRPKFRLCGGWTTFAMHNNLKVGDVCIFELIHRTKLTFLIHIFRETDSSNCSTSQRRVDV